MPKPHSKIDRLTIGTIGLAALVCLAVWNCGHRQVRGEDAAPTVAATTDAPSPSTEPAIKPRAELNIPSLRKLISELQRSRAGAFTDDLRNIAIEMFEENSENVDRDQLLEMFGQVHSLPDSAIHAAVYAPDTEGRARWAMRLDWPIRDLHTRVKAILAADAVSSLLRGVTLSDHPGGGYVIRLPDSPLAYLLPLAGSQSIIASHPDVAIPGDSAGAESQSADGALISVPLNLSGTEKDSGATFFSDFSFLNAVSYSGRVGDSGDWVETVQLDWPPLSGMGAKVFLGRVKQTFFVPNEAFFAAAFNASVMPGVLESMAGFGPQVMFDEGGEMDIVGEESIGPLAGRFDSEICVSTLPGKGFLPAPDIAIQSKSRKPETFAEDIRKAVDEINNVYRERDQKEPWKEGTVRDRTVFWRESGGRGGGFLMPLTMNPVLFMTKETDAKGKERDFLVLGWTSTSPEGFVRRWVDLPRNKDHRFVPNDSKTDGQLWVNWKQLYRWAHPYIDMALNTGGLHSLLPKADAIAEKLSDATITLDLKYTGLTASHQGPIPLGLVTVPSLLSASLLDDGDGASDLARERMASQRLRVLYHHAKLFHKDLGRWPAEVRELDGYIDFAGNPGLLRLKLSSKREWSKWLEELFEVPDEEKEEQEEDETKIDDDVFEIKWAKDNWSLGFAPKTFDHLESLFIDQDGVMHRAERNEKKPVAKSGDSAISAAVKIGDTSETAKEQTP